ncbi:MAG: hypothetical protein MAG431_00550 [Chloroflexi bacterium]|nr:hypothetical protein [Chloroflexota bacterium]
MQCPNVCSASMETALVTRIFYRDAEPVVIRDLKMNVCSECGYETLPLKSARIVENVFNNRIEPVGNFSAPLFQPA